MLVEKVRITLIKKNSKMFSDNHIYNLNKLIKIYYKIKYNGRFRRIF